MAMQLIALLILIISLKIACEYMPNVQQVETCENSIDKCIELCCEIDQIYLEDIKECRAMSNYAWSLWIALLGNMSKTKNVNFLEHYKNYECSLDTCFSPYYERDAAGNTTVTLMEYSLVPCEPIPQEMLIDIRMSNLRRKLVILTALFLSILLFYTCNKKDKKDNLSYRLLTWYLMSMTVYSVLRVLGYVIEEHIQDFPLIYLDYLSNFFWISAHLWLSCIGYYVYVQFKAANDQSTNDKDRMLFIWFSVVVWIGTLSINIAFRVLPIIYSNSLAILIAYFDVLAFLVLSLKICLIRCRVIGISAEKHIKCKLARVIFRLCILMGIPRMISVILIPVIGPADPDDPFDSSFITHFLEPYIVFVTFIAEHESCWTLFRCKCCCSKSQSEGKDNVMGNTTMRGTTTV